MTEERFSKLTFPVHKGEYDTVESLYRAFPKLERYIQQKEVVRENIVKIIKYIIFMYDDGSDLIEEFPDSVQSRKDAAATLSGWIQNKRGEWGKEIKSIMEFSDELVNKIILDYMKVQKNNIFREWMFCEQELDHNYKLRSQMMATESTSNAMERERIINMCDTLVKKIKTYKTQFYEGNPDLKGATENQVLPISPENVFKVLDIPEKDFLIMQVHDVSKN